MPGEKPRAVLQFNEYDFRHRKVLEILRERPRNKTELVVNAILHYMSCPEAAEEFNKSAMKQMIREVICDCLLYTSPSPRDYAASRMPSSA